MRRILLLTIIISTVSASAQSTKDVLVGGGIDLIKTDISQVFYKAQMGAEGHFFVMRHFAVGVGGEYWTTGQRNSFMMGMRYYFTEKLFFRVRGLIGANEVALGMGYSHPLTEMFRIEAMGDFYLINTDFALRAGIAYVIRVRN